VRCYGVLLGAVGWWCALMCCLVIDILPKVLLWLVRAQQVVLLAGLQVNCLRLLLSDIVAMSMCWLLLWCAIASLTSPIIILEEAEQVPSGGQLPVAGHGCTHKPHNANVSSLVGIHWGLMSHTAFRQSLPCVRNIISGTIWMLPTAAGHA
jgi:hypothetical protein